MRFDHACTDRRPITGADVVDGGVGERGQTVDHSADARGIGVTAGTNSTDRLGGGSVMTGVCEDEDEALTDVDGLCAPGLEADGGGFRHGPGVDSAGAAMGDGFGRLHDLVEGLLVEGR